MPCVVQAHGRPAPFGMETEEEWKRSGVDGKWGSGRGGREGATVVGI